MSFFYDGESSNGRSRILYTNYGDGFVRVVENVNGKNDFKYLMRGVIEIKGMLFK